MAVTFKPSFFKELDALPANVMKEADECVIKLSLASNLQEANVDYKK